MRRAVTIAAAIVSAVLFASLAYLVLLDRAQYGWAEDTVRDEATDAVTYNFRLTSDDGGSKLHLTCRPHERIAVILVADEFEGSAPTGQGGTVRLRFDSDPPVERLADAGAEGLVLAKSSDAQSPAFVSRLATSRRLVVESAPSTADERFQALFHTLGADDVVDDLRDHCI